MDICQEPDYGRIPGYVMLYLLAAIPPVLSLLYATNQPWYANLQKDGWYPYLFTSMFFISCVFIIAVGALLKEHEYILIFGLIGIFVYSLAFFVLFQGYEAPVALWLMGFLVVYYMTMMYYVSHYHIVLSVFLFPAIITTIYTFLAIYHLLYINHIPV